MENSINEILKKIFEAFQAKDFDNARKLLDQAKSIDPSNPYIARYEEQYKKLAGSTKTKTDKSKKTIKLKYKGQAINCSSCGSNISLDKYNKESFLAFKKGETDIMKFKCNFCGHDFDWQPQKLKNLFLNFHVGKEINIGGVKYIISGGVTYEGRWQTGRNKGDLRYNERILTDEKGNLNYLSESEAFWQEGGESGVERETEISLKYIPDFDIDQINDKMIQTSIGNIPVIEVSEVKVSALLGENTKSYTIGEKIKLLYFNYGGSKYVIESESTGTQKEMGIYKREFVNINNLKGETIMTGDKISSSIKGKSNIIVAMVIGFIVLVQFVGVYIIPVFILLLVLFVTLKSDKFKYVGTAIISFFIPFLLIYNIYFGTKTINPDIFIKTNSYNEVKGNYRVKIKDDSKKIQYIASTKKYDYGGVRTYYKTTNGFYFSIKNQQDLDLLKEILNNQGSGVQLTEKKFGVNTNQIKDYISDFTENIK